MEIIRILTVDDHAMTALGYKYILTDFDFDGKEIRVDMANSFEAGWNKIEMSARSLKYDIILLDMQLFPDHSKETRSGEDLGIFARKVVPESKIVFMSSYSDSYRINSVFKSVNPDGYMVKSEIDEMSLKAMVRTVTTRPPYYTASALEAVRRRLANDAIVDEQDKKILYHLSIGTRTKDIAPILSVANTTVEARKRQLKSLFGIEHGNDIALIEEARKRGFI
ncbi:histidine kinase [uncultured Kriegella sp.]|uniref:histidine kinase n=1 Tax=uncultured Kriegella sp. TaxID=1798910 RepID=UPI0030D9C0A1|tara:strand:+ start:334882 stop:335550 length:669 start_codon:yes stop_codon:yes gene_type:complete